jgi:tRNA dimethylallyltransferase
VIVLVGPTATGKTRLALELAERLGGGEIVSADSRAVYRWMDIATAKPTPAERARVPHHLLDVVDPDEAYSLADYQRQALAAIARIEARGRTPLVVGGAGLYISAVCDGLSLPDVAPDGAFRAAMEARAREEGWQALQRDLAQVDPQSARRIDPKNVRRVIRALEVHRATGRPFSSFQTALPLVACHLVGLWLERSVLFERIDRRIDQWLAGGLLNEVRALLERGYSPSLPSMSGIGYREMASVIREERGLEQAVAAFKLASHQYAKRQVTWFRRDTRIRWLQADSATADAVLRGLD